MRGPYDGRPRSRAAQYVAVSADDTTSRDTDTDTDTDTVPGIPVSSTTMPIPPVEQPVRSTGDDTLELPVVPAEPPVVPTEPPPAGLVTPPPRPAGQPVGARQRRTGRPSRAGSRPPAWALALATATIVVAGVVGGTWAASRGPSSTSTKATGRVLSLTSVQSFDPVGGSGLRQVAGGGWRTQTYRSATYGGLKSGVGLLVDLGTPQRVTSVETVAAVPGVALELRAGDALAAAPDGFRTAAHQDPAQGPTTLRATDVGRHRYWLVWVPRLAPQADGYTAELDGLTVRG